MRENEGHYDVATASQSSWLDAVIAWRGRGCLGATRRKHSFKFATLVAASVVEDMGGTRLVCDLVGPVWKKTEGLVTNSLVQPPQQTARLERA